MSILRKEVETTNLELAWVYADSKQGPVGAIHRLATAETLAEAGYYLKEASDPTAPAVLKASDGEWLENGTYQIVKISHEDSAPSHQVGDLFVVNSNDSCKATGRNDTSPERNWFVDWANGGTIDHTMGSFVTEVTKVD